MKQLTLAAAMAAMMVLPAKAADYVIDTQGAHAFIQFKISHLGYSWLYGRGKKIMADLIYYSTKFSDPKNKQ